MRRRFTTLACLALAGAATAAAPAADAKPGFGYKTAKFRLAVEGVQTTAWKTDHPIGTSACGVGYKGEGTEVLRFASKPLTVTATSYGIGDPRFRAGRKFGAVLEMPGKVTRRSDFEMWGTPCTDGDGKGGKPPYPPDCGGRKVTVDGEVKFQDGRLLVDRPAGDFIPLPPYRNCHVEGTAFPQLLWRGGGNAVGKRLSARRLFAGRKARTIAVGRRDVYQDAEDWHETTLRYTVKLTRIGKVKEF